MTLKHSLAALFASAAIMAAGQSNVAEAQTATTYKPDVRMNKHYTNAAEREVQLPLNTDGKKLLMAVDADDYIDGRSVKAVARLDELLRDLMAIPPQETLEAAHKQLARKAWSEGLMLKNEMAPHMDVIKDAERQNNIIYVLSVMVASGKLTRGQLVEKYNAELMQVTDIVIHDKDKRDKTLVEAVKNHIADQHFYGVFKQQFLVLLDKIQEESERVLKEGPHGEFKNNRRTSHVTPNSNKPDQNPPFALAA